MNQLRERINGSVYAQVALLLILFWGVHALCLSVFFRGFLGNFQNWTGTDETTFIGATPFHSWSILLRSLMNPVFLGLLLLLYVPHFLRRKTEIVYSAGERMLLAFFAFIITWELITYDYNYYLDSAFYFDRFLLLALCIALFRFPVLTPLFIAFALVYRAQFNYPVAGFPLYDKRILFDLLIVFAVHHYLRKFFTGFTIPVIYFIVCTVVAGYFWCGISKLMISPHGYEWLTENQPVELFNNVNLRGWLSCGYDDLVISMREFLEKYGQILQAFVFVLELGAIVIFWKRRLAIFWLVALIVMHIGILVFGSILFWKWMAVDLALIVFLVMRKKEFPEIFGGRKKILISSAIIASAFLWLKPVTIGWHDTPFNQFFHYEVEGEDGRIYQLDKNEMNPYHQWFQYDDFLFLVNERCLELSGFGYTNNYELVQKLRYDTYSDNSYRHTLEQFGRYGYDSVKADQFDRFIYTYFKNKNARIGNRLFLTALSPPDHLHTQVCGNVYDGTVRAKVVRIYFKRTFIIGGKTQVISDRLIDEISIREEYNQPVPRPESTLWGGTQYNQDGK